MHAPASLDLPSRRAFLQSAALVVTFAATGAPRDAVAQQTASGLAPPRAFDPNTVGGYLAIGADGRVTIYSGKIDWGTGVRAAFRQMVAEELDIALAQIDMIESDTALTPDQGGTGGSTGIPRGGVQFRQAAATARAALLRLASARLNAPLDQLTVADGVVTAPGGARVAYAALLAGSRLDMAIDNAAPLKDPRSYRVVGTSARRPDVPAKVTGTHPYVHNLRLPGMLHGRTVRPEKHGSTIVAVDESSLAGIAGVVKVVRIGEFLGVVAETEWAAVRAAQELKVTWSDWQGLPDQAALFEHVKTSPAERDEELLGQGDADAAIAGAGRKLQASYHWPIQNHASIGPSCGVADVRVGGGAGGATIWTASSNTHRFRAAFARFLALPLEAVRLVYMDGSGAYGMNGAEDAAADAALLSRAVGRPVRVQWMRADEHRWEPKGPPQPVELTAGIDAAGNIVGWKTETWLPAATRGLPAIPLLAPRAAGLPQPDGLGTGLLSQNLDPPYGAGALKVLIHWLRGTPFRPSHIRAPGKIANAFAVESFVDEIAAAAGIDPLAYRRARLIDPRGLAVLARVAERFGWQPRPAGRGGTASGPGAGTLRKGQGIAYVRYKQQETYVALAVEVEVDMESGVVRATRVACAHDCGLIINPDGVRAQIEGAIIQTLSRTLKEEVIFDRAQITSVDWASYPLLTFPEVPEIAVDLIDRRDQPPMGVGEPAATPVPAAVGNAVFDATGVRLRAVPFTPERVKAALTRGA